ncbi:MAG: hypothetical protein ACW99J_18835 [Candidatus Thorarchaeota archaeon]|jgi:hypothetical protein
MSGSGTATPVSAVVTQARTRAEIKAFVQSYTRRGTEKASLIEDLCNEAIDIALREHPFQDATSFDQTFAIATSATSVSIASLSTRIDNIITATIIQTDGEQNKPLNMMDEEWWHRNVINASDNQQGWPDYGLRRGTTIQLNRPAEAGLSLMLTAPTPKTFADDDARCPIPILDVFVTQYVTAFVFLSVNEHEKFDRWYRVAMGIKYPLTGDVGGTLGAAISQDEKDAADHHVAQRPGDALGRSGVAVRNLITGHSDYGNTRLWFAGG